MSIFKGSGVAVVTPFDENDKVNFKVFEQLIDFQLENKTDALIVAGTTGEASTMTDEEQIELIKFAVEKVNKRIPVIAGAGSNDTRHGINLSILAQKAGADALLQVTPYYNKTSQKGLKEHFLAIADNVDIPIILYNVPGRTGLNLLPKTVLELSGYKNIVAIKDATGNLSETTEVARLTNECIDIYSGNDDVVVPVLSVGGKGVISVLANILPLETHTMVAEFLNGNVETARKIQIKYKHLIDILFMEPNPIPVKAALELMGYKVGKLRLPLTKASNETVLKLKEEMRNLKII